MIIRIFFSILENYKTKKKLSIQWLWLFQMCNILSRNICYVNIWKINYFFRAFFIIFLSLIIVLAILQYLYYVVCLILIYLN